MLHNVRIENLNNSIYFKKIKYIRETSSWTIESLGSKRGSLGFNDINVPNVKTINLTDYLTPDILKHSKEIEYFLSELSNQELKNIFLTEDIIDKEYFNTNNMLSSKESIKEYLNNYLKKQFKQKHLFDEYYYNLTYELVSDLIKIETKRKQIKISRESLLRLIAEKIEKFIVTKTELLKKYKIDFINSAELIIYLVPYNAKENEFKDVKSINFNEIFQYETKKKKSFKQTIIHYNKPITFGLKQIKQSYQYFGLILKEEDYEYIDNKIKSLKCINYMYVDENMNIDFFKTLPEELENKYNNIGVEFYNLGNSNKKISSKTKPNNLS